MKSKYAVSIGLLVLALGGCVSPKAYVDPKYAGTSYSEIKRVEISTTRILMSSFNAMAVTILRLTQSFELM